MSDLPSEKEITFKYNGYEIDMKIEKDYDESLRIIEQKLYFQKKDTDKYQLYYEDSEGYINYVNKKNYEDAYSQQDLTIWGFTPKAIEQKVNSEEINALKDKFKKIISQINEKIKEMKKDLTTKFTEIMNDKIKEINKQYKDISQLSESNKQLNKKNQKTLEEMEKMNEASILNLLNEMNKYAEDKIKSHLENYEKTLDNNLKSITIQINAEKEKRQKTLDDLKSFSEKVNNIKSQLEKSKTNINSVYSKYGN